MATLHHGREYRVDRADDEGGEEEDAQPDGERAQQRVHVNGFGTGDRLPHLGGYIEQSTQPGNSLGYPCQLLAERHHVLIQCLQYLVQVREVYR